jgi:hypothetical protein
MHRAAFLGLIVGQLDEAAFGISVCLNGLHIFAKSGDILKVRNVVEPPELHATLANKGSFRRRICR